MFVLIRSDLAASSVISAPNPTLQSESKPLNPKP